MKRFHKGGKQWRKYSIDHIIHHDGIGNQPPYYEILPISKTNGSRKKSYNRKCKSIFTYKGERLYAAIKHYMNRRGNIKCRALFPQPLPKWKKDEESGNWYGYKNVPIGCNSLQRLYDNMLSKCLNFDNVYYRYNAKKRRKEKKVYYSIHGFRTSCIAAAACGNMHNDGILCLSQQTPSQEVATYMRDCRARQKTQRAQEQFKSFVLNGMFLLIEICKIYIILQNM